MPSKMKSYDAVISEWLREMSRKRFDESGCGACASFKYRSLYTRGNVMYSYRDSYPIGVYYSGRGCQYTPMLMVREGPHPSVTTSKHANMLVRNAPASSVHVVPCRNVTPNTLTEWRNVVEYLRTQMLARSEHVAKLVKKHGVDAVRDTYPLSSHPTEVFFCRHRILTVLRYMRDAVEGFDDEDFDKENKRLDQTFVFDNDGLQARKAMDTVVFAVGGDLDKAGHIVASVYPTLDNAVRACLSRPDTAHLATALLMFGADSLGSHCKPKPKERTSE